MNKNDLGGEIWKDVTMPTVCPRYLVSNFGRIKIKKHVYTDKKRGNIQMPEKIVNQHLRRGYTAVPLYLIGGKQRLFYVHKIVGHEFVENPENKPFINHKDGVKNNNLVENLEWCTHQENIIHSVKTGLRGHCMGENNGHSKLKGNDVIEIFNSKLNATALAERYNVTYGTIKKIQGGTSWSKITRYPSFQDFKDSLNADKSSV